MKAVRKGSFIFPKVAREYVKNIEDYLWKFVRK